MSAAKRSLTRRGEAQSAAQSPASKRLKTTNGSHVPSANDAGLGFLVDEDKRAGRKLEARLTNGIPRSKSTRVDESRAVIAKDEDNDEDEEEEDDDDDDDESADEEMEDDVDDEEIIPKASKKGRSSSQQKALVNGTAADVHEDDNEDGDDDQDENAPSDAEVPDADEASEHEELSFGDMLRNRHPNAIDVSASLPNLDNPQQSLVAASSAGNQALAVPTGTSLGTVLTQALRTNDTELLESCLKTNEIDTIKATIERLQSQHAVALLQRLAERIHKRPGRTGKLMMWVQWTLIAHGGYLATQKDLMKKLRALAQVVRERAKGLQPLLSLKGKLDMLSGQLELRRKIQLQSRAANAPDEEDEDVVYIEGQEDDDWSDSEEVEGAAGQAKRKGRAARKITAAPDAEEDDEESMGNGVVQDEEDDSDVEEEEEDGDMLDVEAEETSNDEDEEADSDEEAESEDNASESSVDSEDDESDASGVKEPKPETLNRKR